MSVTPLSVNNLGQESSPLPDLKLTGLSAVINVLAKGCFSILSTVLAIKDLVIKGVITILQTITTSIQSLFQKTISPKEHLAPNTPRVLAKTSSPEAIQSFLKILEQRDHLMSDANRQSNFWPRLCRLEKDLVERMKTIDLSKLDLAIRTKCTTIQNRCKIREESHSTFNSPVTIKRLFKTKPQIIDIPSKGCFKYFPVPKETLDSALLQPKQEYQKGDAVFYFKNEHFNKLGFNAGICHTQGHRDEMEDADTIIPPFAVTIEKAEHLFSLVGVFDGHGGSHCAEHTAKNIGIKLNEKLKFFAENPKLNTRAVIYNALHHALIELDDEWDSDDSGTTANICLVVDNSTVYTANVGDSRSIIVGNEKYAQLSKDASPDHPEHQAIIEQNGGRVVNGRIDDGISSLGVGASLGDHGVTGSNATVEISELNLSDCAAPGEEAIIVIGCDGVWDVLESSDVAIMVANHTKDSPSKLARDITYSAWKAGSTDNITTAIYKVRRP